MTTFARALRRRVVRATSGEAAHEPDGRSAGDVQYRIDRVSEEGLIALAARTLKPLGTFRLLSEGLSPEGVVVGKGAPTRRVVVDPIDGTRGLMYGKRSAYVLVGVAPESERPRLRDLEVSIMVEIPTPRRGAVSEIAFAAKGRGARIWTEALGMKVAAPRPRGNAATPSTARTLAHGFATFCRFFDGAQDRIGAAAERFFDAALAPNERGAVFEDQYVCTAGLMFGLLTGKDRFVADLRPLFRDRRGAPLLCAHPYDVLGALILEEAGIPIRDAEGRPLDAPLDVVSDVAWVGYANDALRRRYEPALLRALDAEGATARKKTIKKPRRAKPAGRTTS